MINNFSGHSGRPAGPADALAGPARGMASEAGEIAVPAGGDAGLPVECPPLAGQGAGAACVAAGLPTQRNGQTPRVKWLAL